jgi:transcriptional regulator with XRE-family HTH domain
VPALGDVIANNVRAERARRRWTQAHLAELVGWPRTAVHEVESGRRKLGPDDLVALCTAFGIPLTELARGGDPAHLTALGLTSA